MYIIYITNKPTMYIPFNKKPQESNEQNEPIDKPIDKPIEEHKYILDESEKAQFERRLRRLLKSNLI